MFVGSRIHVGEVAGTDVEMVQKTDYPWNGSVCDHGESRSRRRRSRFTCAFRIARRASSTRNRPAVSGVKRFAVNGQRVTPKIQKGYAVVTREWKAGDRIELELPMEPQRVVADQRIKADTGLVALKYGPLIYNVEAADNHNIDQRLGAGPSSYAVAPGSARRVMVIKGQWADGSELSRHSELRADESRRSTSRLPRGGGESGAGAAEHEEPAIQSKVWI